MNEYHLFFVKKKKRFDNNVFLKIIGEEKNNDYDFVG